MIVSFFWINTCMVNRVDPEEIMEYLDEVEYPTSRDELVEAAEDSGAEDEVIAILNTLPDNEYTNSQEVSKALAQVQT